MYPHEIQKVVRKFPQYKNLPSAKKSKAISIIVQSLVAIIIGVFIYLLAKVNNLYNAFVHIYIFFLVINTYDLIVIDFLFFCRKRVYRILGTEHMDKEYKDFIYHFKIFIKGKVYGLVVSIIVEIIVRLIYLVDWDKMINSLLR